MPSLDIVRKITWQLFDRFYCQVFDKNDSSKKAKGDDKGKENVVDADFEDVKEDKEKSA